MKYKPLNPKEILMLSEKTINMLLTEESLQKLIMLHQNEIQMDI